MALIEYIENGSRYDLGGRKRRLVLDGSINRYDKVNKLWLPQRLVMSEAVDRDGGKALLTGRMGYWTDLNGTVRVYPDPDDTTKYLEIGSINPVPFSVRQVNDKYIELFYEQPNGLVRWSFIIWDRVFKTNIRVREGYTGNGQFNLRFELVGLQRQGREVYDGDTFVGNLPDPFAIDGNGDIHPVSESTEGGVVTLGVNIQNPVWPIDIDPTFGPADPSIDGYIKSNQASSSAGMVGTNIVIDARSGSSIIWRGVLLFDASSISAGSTVTGASLDLTAYESVGNSPTTTSYIINRLTQLGINNSCTWNKYDGSNNWTSAGGDFTATNASTIAGLAIPATYTWNDANFIAQMQYAIDNTSGSVGVLLKDANEASVVILRFRSLEYATAAERPKLTIDYEAVTGDDGLMAGGLLKSGVLAGGGFNNFGGFGL